MKPMRIVTSSLLALALASGAALTAGCSKDEHAVVESGTYEGTIAKVEADKREIYVDVGGKELELYFIDATKLTRGGQPAEFSALAKGQKVKVQVEKVGQRLDPLTVEIVE